MSCDSTYLMMIYFKNKYHNQKNKKKPSDNLSRQSYNFDENLSVSSKATTIDIQVKPENYSNLIGCCETE